MTDSPSQETSTGWHITRERLRDGFYAGLIPWTACVVALAGLTQWVGAGQAGRPPVLEVTDPHVFLPYSDNTETAAFFTVTNKGGADDALVSVTSPAISEAMLSRHRSNGGGGDSMGMADSATVPAGAALAMSPYGLDVMVTLKEGTRWNEGDAVPFVLHFRHSDSVKAVATVVRPGS
ncbi:copper chaperone PCu(A)C [Streptomyces sp. NBC_01716]|uniref:copper chaperone PCu(A)C n=1 Tax=Streptomyces sp. NBC_01716 TaxID=2975917 RepID=UPI002E378D67|nr:copper chaperone PCu(A)C [Streptomyces sp. NBC_01716]